MENGEVFVSYAREDREYVGELVSHLRHAGVTIWYDDDVEHGSRFTREIEDRLDGCAAFVPVLSDASRASEWCEAELLHAQEADKPVLPLLLEGRIWLVLRTRQVEDVSDGAMPSEKWVSTLRSVAGAVEPAPIEPSDALVLTSFSAVERERGEFSGCVEISTDGDEPAAVVVRWDADRRGDDGYVKDYVVDVDGQTVRHELETGGIANHTLTFGADFAGETCVVAVLLVYPAWHGPSRPYKRYRLTVNGRPVALT